MTLSESLIAISTTEVCARSLPNVTSYVALGYEAREECKYLDYSWECELIPLVHRDTILPRENSPVATTNEGKRFLYLS